MTRWYLERRRLVRGIEQLVTTVALATVALPMAVGLSGCGDPQVAVEASRDDVRSESSAWSTPVSREELQILGTHLSPSVMAEFTADGKWIIVSGADGVTLHESASTKCVRWFNGTLAEVSPDGRAMLLNHPCGATELRSIPAGQLVWRLPDSGARDRTHFSDDGQYIVCGYRSLLRVETQEVFYQAPASYYFDTIHGGDGYQDPADRPRPGDDPQEAAQPSVLPYIYRAALRHDGRPLITPHSGICSPGGRFLIVQTGEEDSSYDPRYSIVDRQSEERLFSDVASSDALFFHDDQYVLFDESVYRTADKAVCYTLPPGITASALNRQESLLAIGWQNGEVAVLDPLSGKEHFRATVEEHLDTPSQESGAVVSLAFSSDSQRLAAVGRKLTLIEVPAGNIIDALHLGRGSREVAEPERTSPGRITFNADGTRLLLTGRQSDEYIYARAKAIVLWTDDLRRRRHLVAQDYFDRVSMIPPAYFNADGTWAIVPTDGRGSQASQLQLCDTLAHRAIAPVAPFQWHYRRRFVVPDFPRRRLGLGRFSNWHADEIVLYLWSIQAIETAFGQQLPVAAQEWLETFVATNPQSVSWHINRMTLDVPARQWQLRFDNNRIQRLYDLATGQVYPTAPPPAAAQAAELDAIDVPETCWGLAHVVGIAFSPDGARLLASCRWRGAERPHLLAQFEMPSGKLIRDYEGFAHIELIHIAPNNRVAAISTGFYRKTWLIDLVTGETLVELPQGGMCVFSPDSRYAQVGDRYGESQQLLTIETGALVDLQWADRWSFSPNSQYAVGGTGRDWSFFNLATGEKTGIPGELHPTGMRTLSTTEMILPYRKSRFLSVDKNQTRLFDVNLAKSLAVFDPLEIARARVQDQTSVPDAYAPISASRYLYTPMDQHFVYVVEGWRIEQDAEKREHPRRSQVSSRAHSTQLLVGDLETGQQLECSTENWHGSPLQHRIFTPDGEQLITISADQVVCWKLHPPEIAWKSELSGRWIDPETGTPFPPQETWKWSLGYLIHPHDRSILIAADGREAILFSLDTGAEEMRFGPLPINSVLQFGADGAYLHVGYRSNRSLRLYDASSGRLVRTVHFTNGGALPGGAEFEIRNLTFR